MTHQDLKCPQCGGPMELHFSAKHRLKSGRRRPWYRCVDYPECSGTHGAHPDGSPLGIPGDKETRELRTLLHKKLDDRFPWKTKAGREATNRWLEVNGFGGHVAKLTAAECKTALKILGYAIE